MTPNTKLVRSEQHRIEDADPMLLADGFTIYERTIRFEEQDHKGTVVKTSMYAVYTRLANGALVTFFRKPFQQRWTHD